MSKPRIAFISTMCGSPWGGSEELWGQTALRLAKEGNYEIHANVNWYPGPVRQLDELESAGVIIERNRPLRLRHRLLRKVLPIRDTHYLDKIQPDLTVISQGAHFDGAEWMQQCAVRGLRYVPIVHCFVEGAGMYDGLAESLVNGYGKALEVHFVSETNLKSLRRILPTPLENGLVIRNPYNVPFAVRPEWPENAPPYRLACVGRLDITVKGQDILFDVLGQQKWRERPLQVSLFGSGHCEQTLRKLKEQSGLENVVFGGTTSNVAEIWKDHHGLILTSRWEGLPLVVVEAMLCGRICIVTDVGGNAELLTEGETGFIAAAPTTPLVDETLERAWKERDRWRQMGERAAARVREIIPANPIADYAARIAALCGLHKE